MMATSNCMCGALDCPTCGPLQGVGGEEAPALTLEETHGVQAAPSPQSLAAMWEALSAAGRELKAAQESPTTQEHLARAEAEYGVARSRVQAVIDELTRWGEDWRALACLLDASTYRVLPDEIERLRLCERRLAAVVRWLGTHQPDVFRRGIWDAVNAA